MAEGDYTMQSGFTGGFSVGGQGGNSNPPPPPPAPTPPTDPWGQSGPMPQPVQQQPVQAQPMPYQAPAAPAYQAQATPIYPPAPAYPAAPAAPMAGMMGGPGMGMGGGQNPASQDPPGDPNYLFGTKMKDFKTSVTLPAHSLNLEDSKFINLLAGSISLSKDEKKRIVDSIPKLRQEQVDELIRIFEEERIKFIELSPKHSVQLKKLEDQHFADWRDLEMEYRAVGKKEEESAKAEEIRKQLGLQ